MAYTFFDKNPATHGKTCSLVKEIRKTIIKKVYSFF